MTSFCKALRSSIDETINLLFSFILINISFSSSSMIHIFLLYLEFYWSAASHVYEILIDEIEWLFDSKRQCTSFWIWWDRDEIQRFEDEIRRSSTSTIFTKCAMLESFVSFSDETDVVINVSVLVVASYAQNVSQSSHRALFNKRLRQVLSCSSQVFFSAIISVWALTLSFQALLSKSVEMNDFRDDQWEVLREFSLRRDSVDECSRKLSAKSKSMWHWWRAIDEN